MSVSLQTLSARCDESRPSAVSQTPLSIAELQTRTEQRIILVVIFS